jgi:hypothetical protein
MSAGLVAVGNVAYNERDVALVQARSGGFVERLYARALLDPVERGNPWLTCMSLTGSRRKKTIWQAVVCKAMKQHPGRRCPPAHAASWYE